MLMFKDLKMNQTMNINFFLVLIRIFINNKNPREIRARTLKIREALGKLQKITLMQGY